MNVVGRYTASGAWHWWQPRYELRLRRDGQDVLVWTRHRSRRLAQLSRRMELSHLHLGGAELVVVDRRTQRELSAR